MKSACRWVKVNKNGAALKQKLQLAAPVISQILAGPSEHQQIQKAESVPSSEAWAILHTSTFTEVNGSQQHSQYEPSLLFLNTKDLGSPEESDPIYFVLVADWDCHSWIQTKQMLSHAEVIPRHPFLSHRWKLIKSWRVLVSFLLRAEWVVSL